VFHKGRLVGLTAAILVVAAAPSFADGDIKRGQYLFDAAGCAGCHTDHKNKGALLAGGRKLKTPFGIFSSPNITPDPANGIGGWSDSEFIRALRDGISPDG
jgi:mono/diheme cytochrome c family protein